MDTVETSPLREARTLCQALKEEQPHVDQVCRLALALFDQLAPLHGLLATDRQLLEAASLLHDIGFSTRPSGEGHHKESARLIREHAWRSLTAPEVEIVAQVARYHRRSLPSPEDRRFAALSASDQHRVEALASLLRIADGLDRTHAQNARQVSVLFDDQTLQIWVQGVNPLSVCLAAAQKKSDLAAQVFNREIRVQELKP